jgi:hypothetical protein
MQVIENPPRVIHQHSNNDAEQSSAAGRADKAKVIAANVLPQKAACKKGGIINPLRLHNRTTSAEGLVGIENGRR